MTAQDAYGNTVTGYTGTVHLTNSRGVMANYTFQPADMGTHTFNHLVLTQAGSLTETGTDTVNPAITGTTSLTVVAAAVDHLALSTDAAHPQVAGTPFDFTVTAQDAYGNTITTYVQTVNLASSSPVHVGGSTGSMGHYRFTVADLGVRVFHQVSSTLSGTVTITGTDSGDLAITGSTSVTIVAGPAEQLAFMGQPTDTTAGRRISPAVTVAVVDQYGNVETDDNSDMVTLAIGVDPSLGVATLSGTLTMTVRGGVAVFNNLSIDVTGMGYTLHAIIVNGSVPSVDSDPFNIT
jgi:hypothetical protein